MWPLRAKVQNNVFGFPRPSLRTFHKNVARFRYHSSPILQDQANRASKTTNSRKYRSEPQEAKTSGCLSWISTFAKVTITVIMIHEGIKHQTNTFYERLVLLRVLFLCPLQSRQHKEELRWIKMFLEIILDMKSKTRTKQTKTTNRGPLHFFAASVWIAKLKRHALEYSRSMLFENT